MKKLLRGLLAIAVLALGIVALGIANDPVPTPECPPEICGAAR